jgi:uncharacterized membrane protein
MKWEHSLAVDAPASVVWDFTVDIDNLPSVTPTITSVERLDSGPLAVGSRARLKQPRQAPAVWTVTELDEGRAFVWQTRRLWLTMVGAHRIEDLGDSCRNTLTLELNGWGSRLLGALLGRTVRSTIATESTTLKAAAEAQVRRSVS